MGYLTTYTKKDGKEVFKVFYEVRGVDGKRKRKSKNFPYGTKKKDALAYLKEKELLYEQGKLKQSVYDGMLLTEFVENHFSRFVDDLSPYTMSSYRYMYGGKKSTTIKNYFSGCTLQVIDRQAIQDYVDLLSETGYSSKTIRNYVHFLGGIFNIAIRLGAIERSPCENVILPKNNSMGKSNNYLELDEAMIVLKKAEEHSVVCNAIYALLILLGLRRGELLALTWDDIDFDNNTITISKNLLYLEQEVIVKSPKTASGYRTLYLPQYVVNVLKKLRKDYLSKLMKYGISNVSQNIITKDNGKPFMPEHLGRFHRQFFKTLQGDVKYITIHGCRHTAASLMVSQGNDVKSIQETLGHSSLEMTLNIYSHALVSSKKNTAASLDKLINEKINTA